MFPETLKQSLENLPESSGVYHYFDAHSKLLYIGKAKNLKKRVRSYFQFTPTLAPASKLSARISKMISETAHLHYIIVENEHDALVLENSLIKQLKPKYNILLRDDKTFPYIYFDESARFPRLEMTRKILAQRQIRYFGPYTSGASELLASIYELCKLVQKRGCLREKKACLFYQINRCTAPCEERISQKEYAEIFKDALDLLQNRHKLIAKLKDRMERLALELRFEEAGILRDRIKKLAKIETYSEIDLAKLEDLDILALQKGERMHMLLRLFMRAGKIIASSSKVLKNDTGIDENEAYTRAILHYYKENTPLPPSQLLLPVELEGKAELEAHLAGIFGRKIPFIVPKVGAKRRLVELALKNASELLRLEGQKEEIPLLSNIKELLGIDAIPARIEAFDTSHMRGESCVGAMVVYEDGFIKDSYRRYELAGSDEYSQMREMLMRRASAFERESPPDLWLLDGGAGQIKIAREIIESTGANVEIIAIAKEKLDSKAHRAKGAARDILRTQKGEIRLIPSDKRLQFFQKIRDEVHRFAITYHRKKKLKNDQKIDLLSLRGIGRGKLKRLLDYFGNFEGIKQANTDELAKIVGEKIARAIKETL
ncbi:MAG: excinuclease ABC subunit UvrC [Wolinella sp.]